MKKIMHSFWKLIIVLVLGIGAISVAAGTLKTEAETGGVGTEEAPTASGDPIEIGSGDAENFVNGTTDSSKKFDGSNNKNFKLTGDLNLSDANSASANDWLKIGAGTSTSENIVTLDLAGHTLTLGRFYLCAGSNSILVIKDSQPQTGKVIGGSNSKGYAFEAGYHDNGGGDTDANIWLENVTVETPKGVVTGDESGDTTGNVTIKNCTFTSTVLGDAVNADQGGAINLNKKNLSITGTAISGFKASGTYSNGGAIYAGHSTIALTNTTISGNSAVGSGGAIFVTNSTVNVESGSITGNTAPNGNGGAICSYGTSAINIKGGTISGNSANTGGAVYADNATVTIDGGSITENTSGDINNANAQAGNGGAIYTNKSNLTLNSGSISGNKAALDGGGIYTTGDNAYTLTINGGDISGNTANRAGGGIYTAGGTSSNNYTLTINGGTIDNNTAESTVQEHGGGGIRVDGKANFVMNGGTFTNNRSNSGGGAIKIGNYKQNDLIHAAFYNGTFGGSDGKGNTSHKEGGAIWLGLNVYGYIGPNDNDKNQLNISYNKVDDYKEKGVNGRTTDWGGGGVFVADGGTLKIEKAVVENNHAFGFGGGVAGCSTGRIVINSADKNNISTNGIAIFGNTADGDIEHGLSGGDSAKRDDHVIASGNTVFLNNGYNDYFCALDSSVNEEMLGGGSENYTGSYDSKKIENHTEKQVFTASQIMGLTSQASEEDRTKARNSAHVSVTNNSSGTHGGGILCNGIMIMGDNPNLLTFNDRLIVQGLKSIDGQDYDQNHPFTFELLKETGKSDPKYEVVATKNTTAYEYNLAKGIQNIDSFQNKGIIEITVPYSDIKPSDLGSGNTINDRVFYLREKNAGFGYQTDPTVYKITVQGKRYTNNDSDNRLMKATINKGDNTTSNLSWTANQIDNVTAVKGTFVNDVFTEDTGAAYEKYAKKLDTGKENGVVDLYNHAKYLWLGISGTRTGESTVNEDTYTAKSRDRKPATSTSGDNTTDFAGGFNGNYGVRAIDDNENYEDSNSTAAAPNSDWTVNLEAAFTNQKVKSYSVEKIWNDADNADGVRPDTVEAQLYQMDANGNYVPVLTSVAGENPVELNKNNNWRHTWENLPSDGQYTVKEFKYDTRTPVEGTENDNVFKEGENNKEGYTVSYTEVKNVEVNAYNQPAFPKDGVQYRLIDTTTNSIAKDVLGNDVPVITLKEENHWTDTFRNLPENLSYRIERVTPTPEGYETKQYLYDELSTFEFDGIVATNTHNQETTTVGVTKRWLTNDPSTQAPVQLDLYADGVKQDDKSIILDGTVDPVSDHYEDQSWHAQWNNLPKSRFDGKKSVQIKYTVKEDQTVPGYQKSYRSAYGKKLDTDYVTDGQIIYNIHLIDFTVTKKWNDNDNQAGKRPDRIRVRLRKGDKADSDEKELSADNNWTYTWKDLPEIDDYGKTVSYSVEEVNIDSHYTASTEQTGNNAVITNTYQEENRKEEKEEPVPPSPVAPSEVRLTIHKTFKGDQIPDQNKKNLTFHVTGTGKKTDETGNPVNVKVDETVSYASFSNGSYTFDHLYPGEYKVTETNSGIKGYKVSVKYVVDGKTSQKVNAAEAGKEYRIDITDEYHKDDKKNTVDTSDHTNLPWSAGIFGISVLIIITTMIFRKRYN